MRLVGRQPRTGALQRMLWRDLWHLRGQLLAVLLVVMSGVAAFVAMHSTYRSLLSAQLQYYRSHQFADVFVTLKRAPQTLLERVQALEGVAQAESRIVADAMLDVPGLDEPATGRLISLPRSGQPLLNRIELRAGRLPDPQRADEAVVSAAFATANRLQPGDSVGAILNGRWRRLQIVGTGLSPEYVYEAGNGSIFPDNRRFGVIWLAQDTLAGAFDLEGAFNSLALRLQPGVRAATVLAPLDHLLSGHGGLGAYSRDDQLSHRFLSDEIAQNRITATYVPAIFLAVAGFLLHIVLGRLVQLRRSEIGLLKAFGYSDARVAAHYLQLAGIVVAAGSLAGIGVGLTLAQRLTAMYLDYYRFPALPLQIDLALILLAFGLGLGAAIAGALHAVLQAAALPPAEAMRAEAPTSYQAGWLERSGLQRQLSPAWRMILRNLLRRRWKAVLSTLGIALSVAILVIGGFFFDSIDYLMQRQFRQLQREDVMVMFNRPLDRRAYSEMAHLPGVLRIEPLRTVAARLRAGHRQRLVELTGLSPTAELRRIGDVNRRTHALPPGGMLLPAELARRMALAPGDRVELEILEGRRPTLTLEVTGLSHDLIGTGVYIDRQQLNRLLQEPDSATAMLLQTDPLQQQALYRRLKQAPQVAGVMLKQVMLDSFQDIIDRSMLVTMLVNLVFAAVIAFGMVYNGARITLSERGNELACLRVLGFQQGEVARILLGEQMLLALLAVPLGWLLGWGCCWLLSSRLTTELYRIPLVISAQTYGYAALTIAVAALLSGLLVARRLRQLDLIAVLKTRE